MPDYDADELYMITAEKVLIPFTRTLSELAKKTMLDEIDEQDLIDTGRFRASIDSSVNVSNIDNLEVTVFSKDCVSDKGYAYPIALEFGTIKMAARAPFRKAIARVEAALKEI